MELLPEELREIVILRFSQELKLGEIAKITDLPMRNCTVQAQEIPETVKKRIRRREKEWKPTR